MSDWQVTPHQLDTDIATAADHIEALLPKEPKTSWGRISDRLDGATREELLLLAKQII